MTYEFFIVLGLLIVCCGFGFWRLGELQKKVARLYGTAEMAGEGDDDHATIVRRVSRLEACLEEFEPRLRQAEHIGGASVHKIGFLRFNPFQDTGGDNSFILVLLDAENSGVMVSSLFAREGVRMYAKAIERGRSRHQLSEEEKGVLDDTIQKKI